MGISEFYSLNFWSNPQCHFDSSYSGLLESSAALLRRSPPSPREYSMHSRFRLSLLP